MSPDPVRIGLLGAGDIAGRYAETLARAPGVRLVGAAGRSFEAAGARLPGVPILSADDLLRPDVVDLIVNLTPPQAHAETTRRALRAGLHVYSEKPLATTLEDARDLIALAARSNRVLACAPGTILGPAQQTARRMIDAGELGRIWGAAATLIYPGPDLWHHDADRLFAPGAGAVFDMGVYDVAALVHLLGPVRRVAAGGGRARDERTIQAGPRAGERFPVVALTHASALLFFERGATATLTVSFDGPGARRSELEIYGTDGTLGLPRSGDFAGACHLSRAMGRWDEVAPVFPWEGAAWPIGVLDAADAVRTGREPRASATQAFHVLDVLIAINRAIATETLVDVASTTERPDPMPADLFARLVGVQTPELVP